LVLLFAVVAEERRLPAVAVRLLAEAAQFQRAAVRVGYCRRNYRQATKRQRPKAKGQRGRNGILRRLFSSFHFYKLSFRNRVFSNTDTGSRVSVGNCFLMLA